jgi:peptidoglycan/xylan/chitin deacetylase (PgdA/CDA1 family)
MEERMTAHRLLARILFKPYPDIVWRLPVNGVQQNRHASEKNICLTFDDGPNPPATKLVLGILKELKTPATFFLSGEKIFTHRREIKKLNYKAHSIGSHFFHHIPIFALSSERIRRELQLTDRFIQGHFGIDSQLFRPPYGIFSPSLLRMLRTQNRRMILWSLMAYDFKWSAERVIRHLKKSVRGGDVVVFHDSEKAERILPVVLPEFIQFCREKGFKFKKI